MKTVFPEEPTRDFNEWMGYIKSEIDKSNKIKKDKCVESNTYEGSRERMSCFFLQILKQQGKILENI